jgi:3-methylfumaryl-CoA hydratase
MPAIDTLKPGDLLPGRQYTPDNVQLFLYNAALWNAHRIHFDHPYATQVEGYSGLVIAGPLLGEWLAQCVVEWLGDDGRLSAIEYSNRKVAIIGETLQSGGVVLEVDAARRKAELELYIKNGQGEVVAPGTATVRFD